MAALELFRDHVRPEWLDYNGHLNDGFFAVIFSRATDQFLIDIGLGADVRQATRHTIYTLETHVRFLHEVKEGRPIVVTAQILEVDAKRLRLFLWMREPDEGFLAATSEQLLISVDQGGEKPRSAPWLPACAEVLHQLAVQHRDLPVPAEAGKGIALKR